MSFGQFLSILRARWWIGLLVLALTVGTTVVVSQWLPKQYTATASIVVDAKPDPVSAMIYAAGANPAYMATQIDVINSPRVAQRVVRDLKLTDNPQIRAQWQEETGGNGSIEQWLAGSFSKAMDVKPSRESNVINISYRAPDPRFAAGLANAFVQAYIATSLELRVDPAKQYSNFFDTRSKEARENLEVAQRRLSAFQREKGIVATEERLDIENARLSELSSQLVALQALASESGSRQAQAQGASGDRMQEVLNNGLILSLKGDISRNEARLQEIEARLGDAHPQVVEAKANIASLRARLESETKRVTGGVTVTNTINRQREAEVRASLEAQRSKVLKMKAVRDEGAVLVRDVESAQRGYDAVLARFTQSSLESQTTQSSVYPLTPATPPLVHSSPNLLLNTGLALFLGLLLALGCMLAIELLDRRVRSPRDIVEAINLPVIGVLPRPGRGGLLGREVPLIQQRVLARLPVARKEA